MKPIGKRTWAIAEGYIPGWSHGPEPQMTSHETACILNTSDEEAHVSITIFFSDKDAGDLRGQPSERLPGCVHDVPLARNFPLFGEIG